MVLNNQAPAAERATFHRLVFQSLGTQCQIDFACDSASRAREFKADAAAWVESFEARFSRFRPDSLVSRVNALAGRDGVELDDEGVSLFGLIDWYHWSTGGLFDPSALPLLNVWDYHQPGARPPSDEAVREALENVGWKKVVRDGRRLMLPAPGMGIDVGGIGKEYAVDRVFQMGVERGFPSLHVNFGNDLRVSGPAPQGGPWLVGLEDPRMPGECWGGVALTGRAVATSGDYLRFFSADGRRFGHILDPRTGRPAAHGGQSVTVIAPTCTEAGILSTTAFILGLEEGHRLINGWQSAEGCLWQGDRRIQTEGFGNYVCTRT
jgi:thiamine biosynthesis lipoprotein